ncbi:TlpA disulfide reductase family protein [Salisediminibacterium beveridgei]|uniref:TlpA disulfide reductase family protein n=1 Tax=Salisediminibacterium beveridgei TaxID=632773 RepID=UPI001E2BB64C|nr:TlpA disulfide reductase family protein [Salisediminibacterium beveridgei]
MDDFKGKPLVLTFWVSWCPDCQRDLALKDALIKKMSDQHLQFLMIHVPGRESDPEAGLMFMEQQNYSFLTVQDDGMQYFDKCRCMSLPTTFILNKELQITASLNDKSSFEDLMSAIGNVVP